MQDVNTQCIRIETVYQSYKTSDVTGKGLYLFFFFSYTACLAVVSGHHKPKRVWYLFLLVAQGASDSCKLDQQVNKPELTF